MDPITCPEGELRRPEPGWKPLASPDLIGGFRPFTTGEQNRHLFRLSYFVREEDGALAGKAWFGPGAEGPPDHAHGGSIAGVFDEIMGASAWLSGYAVLAARVTAHFRLPVPLGKIVRYEARVSRVEGKKIFTACTLGDGEGTLYAEGEGVFIRVRPEHLKGMESRVREIVERANLKDW